MRALNFNKSSDRQYFYNTKEWKAAREIKKSENPICEKCLIENRLTPTEEVHHKKPLKFCSIYEALDIENLESLCKECHSRETYLEVLVGTKEFKLAKPMWTL